LEDKIRSKQISSELGKELIGKLQEGRGDINQVLEKYSKQA